MDNADMLTLAAFVGGCVIGALWQWHRLPWWLMPLACVCNALLWNGIEIMWH
jgi:fatty acid desaturase